MKKILLLLSFSLLLSGCSANYDVPAQVTQSYKEQPAIVEVQQKQATVDNAIDQYSSSVNNKKVQETPDDNNLSNNNTYINVDGNQVHSPAYADSVPSGASAICRDGTYSFSQHRQGTCSGHGGVASWY